MSSQGWQEVGKVILVIIVFAIPFAIGDWGIKLVDKALWARFLFFPFTVIIGTACVTALFKNLGEEGKNWDANRIFVVALLFVYGIVAIVGSFSILSGYPTIWRWVVWTLGIIIWIILSIFTVILTSKLFSE